MRTALHVAAKDLRAHRLLLAAWGVALAADLALSTGWAHRAVADWPMTYDITRLVVSPLTTLLGAFVAIGAIHADPAVSTTALWLTRPIGRGTLLAAKLLVAALAVGVTAVEQQLAAVVAGASAGEASRILAEAVFIQALIVLPLAAVATLTADAGRYLLALVAVLAALPVVQTVLSYVGTGRVLAGPPVTALFTAAGLLLASSLAVMAHQLLTRKTRRSSGAAAVSAILVLAAFNAFTPAGRQVRLPPPEDHGSTVSIDTRREIKAQVGDGGLQRLPAGQDRVQVLVDWEVTGQPADTVAVPIAVRASWSVAGGQTIESREIGFPSGWWNEAVPNQPVFREAVGRLLGAAMIDPPGGSGFAQRALRAGAGFDLASLGSNGGRAGTLTLDVELLLVRLRDAGRLPLEPGRETWAGAHHLVVLAAREDRPGVRVSHLRPALLLHGGMWHHPPDGLSLVVFNEARGEAAVAVGAYPESQFGGALSHVRHRTLSLGYPMPEDAQWLAAAKLVAVEIEPQGMIRRIVRVEGVRFEDLPEVHGRSL